MESTLCIRVCAGRARSSGARIRCSHLCNHLASPCACTDIPCIAHLSICHVHTCSYSAHAAPCAFLVRHRHPSAVLPAAPPHAAAMHLPVESAEVIVAVVLAVVMGPVAAVVAVTTAAVLLAATPAPALRVGSAVLLLLWCTHRQITFL